MTAIYLRFLYCHGKCVSIDAFDGMHKLYYIDRPLMRNGDRNQSVCERESISLLLCLFFLPRWRPEPRDVGLSVRHVGLNWNTQKLPDVILVKTLGLPRGWILIILLMIVWPFLWWQLEVYPSVCTSVWVCARALSIIEQTAIKFAMQRNYCATFNGSHIDCLWRGCLNALLPQSWTHQCFLVHYINSHGHII